MESETKKKNERKKETENVGYRIRLGKTMLRHLRSLVPISLLSLLTKRPLTI